MTTALFAMTLNPNTLADFVSSGENFSAAMSAVMTRVTTTGDINWATVLAPTTVNVYRGFEVFKLNAPFDTTHPLFIKFEYGVSGLSTNSYGLRVTISKAVDAAGVQSGIVWGPTEILQATATTTPITCYVTNGDNSGLGIMIAPASGNGGAVFLLERSRDTLGALTSDAFYVGYKATQTGQWNNRFYNYALGTYNQISGGVGCIPLTLAVDSSLANATVTPYFPVACISPGGDCWISRIVLAGARTDCAVGSIITGLFDSANYIGAGIAGFGYDQRNSAYGSLMMRWD